VIGQLGLLNDQRNGQSGIQFNPKMPKLTQLCLRKLAYLIAGFSPPMDSLYHSDNFLRTPFIPVSHCERVQ